MVTVKIVQQPLHNVSSDSYTVFCKQDVPLQDCVQELQELVAIDLVAMLRKESFAGKAGSLVCIPAAGDAGLVQLLFVGLGKPAKGNQYDLEQVRRALGLAVKTVQRKKITSNAMQLPRAAWCNVAPEVLYEQAATIVHMAVYEFDTYITDETRKAFKDSSISFAVPPAEMNGAALAVKRGSIIGDAVNEARLWIDMPPSDLTPPQLASKAEEIAKRHSLPYKIFNEEQIRSMGMGGLAGVSAGSHQDCQFVVMEYRTQEKSAPTLAFVGKGITFDSGGLSLKPPVHMETMKEDMSGAAAVLATMDALAQLKPKVNVIGITALSENLPSGTATKPGDILRFYNGKTAEVKNTDAEGRLVLADALSYAVKHYKPDAIVDVATLTGACMYALGPFFTGMMSQHDTLVRKVEGAASVTGDRVWRLPLDDDYRKAIVSNVADICNIGNEKYRAGAITAGFFLKEFVGDTPWVHLDIAGTAFAVPDISYYSSGATGAGVRLLVELARGYTEGA